MWGQLSIYLAVLIIGSPIIKAVFPNSILAFLIFIALSLVIPFLVLPLLPFWKKIKTPSELD